MRRRTGVQDFGAAVLAVAALTGLALEARGGTVALPEGLKTVTLVAASGERMQVGTATFAKDGEARTFTVALDAPALQVEFLSMRNFSCLRGDKETWCHVPCPYETKSRITPDDLMDLEYALLFLFKPPTGYGISTWNGLYFRLAAQPDGSLAGAVHDVNLEPLGVPLTDSSVRPIQHSDVTPADPATHRFARIEIR